MKYFNKKQKLQCKVPTHDKVKEKKRLKMRDEQLKPVWSMKKVIEMNINQRHENNMMHFNQSQDHANIYLDRL